MKIVKNTKQNHCCKCLFNFLFLTMVSLSKRICIEMESVFGVWWVMMEDGGGGGSLSQGHEDGMFSRGWRVTPVSHPSNSRKHFLINLIIRILSTTTSTNKPCPGEATERQ